MSPIDRFAMERAALRAELARLTEVVMFQTDVRLTIACLPETDETDG